ncbi:MAG: hypothetical protein P4L95_15355 [Rouxiella aceris]|uniref:hypothetical protein n=1 Tax=Rouxiella aceris TaxID=2703884 RepID=UPI00284DACBE|nr:hypothetical protein [Rouxiella aceris]MDR3433257.1 hypothetical protein [Rouxiella aceris]
MAMLTVLPVCGYYILPVPEYNHLLIPVTANMEKVPRCAVHVTKSVEYVCPVCGNLDLCDTCKQEHVKDTGHAPKTCKEVGLAIMHQRIQDLGVKQASELTRRLIKDLRELEAVLQQELDGLQVNCVQTDEWYINMKKLDREGRHTELYFYAKSLPAGGAKNKAAMERMNKYLLKILCTASDGLEKVRGKIAAAAQHKPVFAAYHKDEVLVLKGESYKEENKVVSTLRGANNVKAVYIHPWYVIGDRVASELAACLQINTVSAIYLNGYNISDSGAAILARAAFRGMPLSAFCVVSNIISDAGAKAVAEAVRNCPSLTTFYLTGDNISDSGAMAVAEAVRSCPLSAFCLWGGKISDSGAVAAAVKDCPLSAFYLGSGKISDSGAVAVAEAVKDCPLSAFYLGSCEISDSGATDVADIMSRGGCSSTLSAFCLAGNDISDPCAKSVADAVRSCPLLSAFYLGGTQLSGKTVAYILEGMASTKTIRSVNLIIGEISKGQMDSCLNRVRQGGVGKQLKLRFECDRGTARTVCEEFSAE